MFESLKFYRAVKKRARTTLVTTNVFLFISYNNHLNFKKVTTVILLLLLELFKCRYIGNIYGGGQDQEASSEPVGHDVQFYYFCQRHVSIFSPASQPLNRLNLKFA